MRKSTFALIILVITTLFSNELVGQKFSGLDKSPMDVASFPDNYEVSDKIVKVTYSRPQLNGRKLASLAPEGKIWRTGANEAVEITFYKDVKFGGKSVDAGTYTLFTIPGEKEWTIILSTAKNVWGSYFYKESEDVVRVTGKVSSSIALIDAFSITFDKNMNLYMGWEYTVIKVKIKQ